MGKFSSKHVVEEIQGTRCTLVESGINKNRLDFLKSILEANGLKVCFEAISQAEGQETLYKIGVTDLTFNPTIAIFGRRLKTPDGTVISPKYWLQETDSIKPYYWLQ
jgi:hypothetical protein